MASTPFKLRSQGSSFKMMGSSPAKDHERDMTTGAIIQHPEETKRTKSAKEVLADLTVKGVEKLVNVVTGRKSTQVAKRIPLARKAKQVRVPLARKAKRVPPLKPIDASGELTKIKETPKSKETSEPKGTMSKEEVENMPKGA